MPDRISKRISIGMMTVICAAVLSSCGTKTIESDATVMEIDQQTVQKEEYQMIAQSYIAEVTRQYTTEEANQKDFWTTEFAEGKPVEKLIALTKEELIEKKVVAKLAEDAGIDSVSDYQSLKDKMDSHNEESAYGLTNMDISDYYEYAYTELESELIEYLKKENPRTEEELRQIYEENKEDYTSEVSVEMLVAEMPGESDESFWEEIRKALSEETDTEVLSALYPDTDFYTISLSSLDPQEGKTGVYTKRWEIAASMEQDAVSEPFYAENHILMMRCLERSENALQPFEEVKGVLESQVLTSDAKAIIQEEISRAEVTETVDLEQVTLEAVQ